METTAAAVIFFSRIPGEEVPPPPSHPSALYSLHVTDMGLVITYRWTWDTIAEEWQQYAPLFAETLQLAREMVPPEAAQVVCPPEFGIELYEVA